MLKRRLQISVPHQHGRQIDPRLQEIRIQFNRPLKRLESIGHPARIHKQLPIHMMCIGKIRVNFQSLLQRLLPPLRIALSKPAAGKYT